MPSSFSKTVTQWVWVNKSVMLFSSLMQFILLHESSKNCCSFLFSYFLLPFCHRSQKRKKREKRRYHVYAYNNNSIRIQYPPLFVQVNLRQDRSADVICYAKHCYYPFLATTTTHQTMIVKMMMIWMLWIQAKIRRAHTTNIHKSELVEKWEKLEMTRTELGNASSSESSDSTGALLTSGDTFIFLSKLDFKILKRKWIWYVRLLY